MKARRRSGESLLVHGEKVVPKQAPGVMLGGRVRGSPSQGREEAWVCLACWIWGRRTDTACRAA